MRSKATNFLQAIILLTGIIYLLIGLVFYISPLFFGRIFSIQITDDWINGIQYDMFIAPLFFLARGFAAMVFCIGLSMVLPLFDPLKYRGLVYFTGIVFPVLSSSLLLFNGIKLEHFLIILIGSLLFLILILTVIGLSLTKKEAKSGIE